MQESWYDLSRAADTYETMEADEALVVDRIAASHMTPARVLFSDGDNVLCNDGTMCPLGSGCCPGVGGVTACCPQENVRLSSSPS